MKSVGASYFKEHCLELLAQLDAEGLVIHQNGKAIAKIIPHEGDFGEQQTDEWKQEILNGSLRDKVKIHGDIYSTGIRWDAESGHPHSGLHH